MRPRRVKKETRCLDLHLSVLINQEVYRSRRIPTVRTPEMDGHDLRLSKASLKSDLRHVC